MGRDRGMVGPGRNAHPVNMIGGVAIAIIVMISVLLRLHDPFHTTVIAGIDPYRHMSFTRNLFVTGELPYYPPGLATLLAAVWVYTGADLYQIVRFAPVVLGAVGVLGMGMLLMRHLGPVPAVVGSLGYAILAGFIKFTTKLTPTALDLAVAPFLFYFLLEVVRGRLGWAVPLALLAFYIVVAHPWFYGLVFASVVLFLVFWFVFEGQGAKRRGRSAVAGQDDPVSARGIAMVVAVIGGCFGMMLTRLGGITMAGGELLPEFLDRSWMPWAVIAASSVPLLFALVFRRAARGFIRWRSKRSLPLMLRVAASVLIASVVVAMTVFALHQGLPRWVDLPLRFGWPALVLGAAAMILVPFLSNRIALLGAAFAAVTYPMTLFDFYGISWLPFRMSFFFGIGLMILVAVAVRALMQGVAILGGGLEKGLGRRAPRTVSVIALPVVLVLAGTVYVTTPEHSEWYRLHDECGIHAMREAGAIVNEDPDALLLTGGLQSMQIMRAFVDDSSRVWRGDWWIDDYEDLRYGVLKDQEEKRAPVYVLVDPATKGNVDDDALGFLADHHWQPRGGWCPDEGGSYAYALYTSGPLYDDCGLEAIKRTAEIMDADPEALLFTGSWIAKTILDVYLDEPDQARSGSWWIRDYHAYRYEAMKQQEEKGAPLYVFLDPHTQHEVSQENLSFLGEYPWETQASWCWQDDQGHAFRLYANSMGTVFV